MRICVRPAELGDRCALEPLLELLDDPSVTRFMKRSVARALGLLGDRRAVPHLVAAFADPNDEFRINVAAALVWLGAPEARPVVEELAADERSWVRSPAEARSTSSPRKAFDSRRAMRRAGTLVRGSIPGSVRIRCIASSRNTAAAAIAVTGPVVLTGSGLTLEQVVQVARERAEVALAPHALARMRAAREVVDATVGRGEAVYGLTTGVGVRKRALVALDELPEFNRMLILNHRVGQGHPAPEEVVRATMLRLANGLATGVAGARPELAELVVGALNAGFVPQVRTLGSVGQADLPAMADLAFGLIGDFELAAGEGLALLNNNAFSTGAAALAIADCVRLLDALDVAGALDLEAFAANLTILHPAIGEARPYPGLQASLARLRECLEGSYLWDEGAARNLQDPLTFRCLPQVHGAVRGALEHTLQLLEIELNGAQGNPLVVAAEERIISVANFDVLPLAAALDYLRIALAPALTSAAERSLKLLQAPLTGLPEGLAVRHGLAEDSLSEFGVPVQGFAAEARLLAQPVSFEVVSTTHPEGIEDRITMAPLAARRLAAMVELGERLAAIELAVAAQAVDLRGRPRLGARTAPAYERVRELIPFSGEGEAIPQDLEPVRDLVRSGALS